MPTARASCRRIFLLLIAALFCSACTIKTWEDLPGGRLAGRETAYSEEAKAGQIWQRFIIQAATAESTTGPFRISASLRYTDASRKSTRVSALLWGNGNTDTPYPLRLDLLAGVGSVVAKIKEDPESFVAYVPEESTAYILDGDERTLNSFGVPIPLSLGDLTLLLSGRCGALFLPPGARAMPLPPYRDFSEKSVSFILSGARLPGVLELSPTGAPLSWKELRQEGWSIHFETGKAGPLLPEKLRIAHPQGYSALIVVKEIARVSPPFADAQMALDLPPGTPTRYLPEPSIARY